MSWMPQDAQAYLFNALHGLAALLPPCRFQNRPLYGLLAQALHHEPQLTKYDREHLDTLFALADRVLLPAMASPKQLAETEAYLSQRCSDIGTKRIRYALRWLFVLLARHGLIETDLAVATRWTTIWRRVQAFKPMEQLRVSEYIDWLVSKRFSVQTINDCIRELWRFTGWMTQTALPAIESVTNDTLAQYVLERGGLTATISKKSVLSSLKPYLYYYQYAVNGGFRVPSLTYKVGSCQGVSISANSEALGLLWEAMADQRVSGLPGLLLFLVLAYGLPLRVLPHLRLTTTPHTLMYTEQRPSLLGIQERTLPLALSAPWMVTLWENALQARNATAGYPYLVGSGHGVRRGKPVSVDHCQRMVQLAVKGVLGYPIAVNHLSRGALKHLAKTNPLTDFMAQSQPTPLSKHTRLMTWLYNKDTV
jgi:hypothetical protein